MWSELASKLLLALCVRKGELLAARWEEFDLDGDGDAGPVWHLPASRTKTGAALDIPLVPEVVEWFRALQLLAAGSEQVFPQRRRDPRQRVPHVGLDTLNVALTRVTHGLEPFTLHDLRRTARTHLAALGVPRPFLRRRRSVSTNCERRPAYTLRGSSPARRAPGRAGYSSNTPRLTSKTVVSPDTRGLAEQTTTVARFLPLDL